MRSPAIRFCYLTATQDGIVCKKVSGAPSRSNGGLDVETCFHDDLPLGSSLHYYPAMNPLVTFKTGWMDASALEASLRTGQHPHESQSPEIRFVFPTGCKVMIDAAVRLLSLFNQLDNCCKRVTIEFEEGEEGAMGYLNRMGFFDHLSPNVEVEPSRPSYSGAALFGGGSLCLVEIAEINAQKQRDKSLPTRLTNVLMQACEGRTDAPELAGAAWTIFAELIDNIFSHSETQLAGYAALQVYPGGNILKVAVSDSGHGIMKTLRPSLESESPTLAALSDIDLLVEVFRQGISRHGADRGCGLKGSAQKAMKFKADLDVRLPNIRVRLKPGREGYKAHTAYCYQQLPLLWGTHICFTFGIDNIKQSG